MLPLMRYLLRTVLPGAPAPCVHAPLARDMSGSRGARDGKAVTTMELAWGASSAHPPVLALLSAVAAQPVVDGINGSGSGPFY